MTENNWVVVNTVNIVKYSIWNTDINTQTSTFKPFLKQKYVSVIN